MHHWEGIPLQRAAANGHLPVVECSLEAGADVHVDNGMALYWAAENSHLPVVPRLLDAGIQAGPIIDKLEYDAMATHAQRLSDVHRHWQKQQVTHALAQPLDAAAASPDGTGLGL